MKDILVYTPPLVAVSAIFLLSLIGAVVMFRFLKATAVFKTVQGQASGALAGFLMILAALGGIYLKLTPGTADAELWTITGRVETEGSNQPRYVEVRVLPPPPQGLTNGGRDFRLEHVEVVSGVWPELQLSATGFFPETVLLKAGDLELYPERKLAVIKKPLALAPESVQAAQLDRIEGVQP